MTMTSAQRVRLKISDPPKIGAGAGNGDGTAVSFTLSNNNVVSGTAYVIGAGGGWSATGATFDPTGVVTFATRISAGSAFRVSYVYSTFSEDEIAQFLSDGGSVVGAAKEAIVTLMFDGLRRAVWVGVDGSSFDDTKAQTHLRAIYQTLSDELADEATGSGYAASWSLEQGNY